MKQKRLEFKLFRRENGEISILQRALQDIEETGAVQVVFVRGLSGTGKTTAAETAINKRKDDYVYATAKFDQGGSAEPFSALRHIVSEICTQICVSPVAVDCKFAIDKEVTRSHQKVLTSLSKDIKPLLQTLKPAEDEDSPMNTSSFLLSGDEGLNIVKQALRSFFRAVSKVSSVVICMDDIMWSDQTTLDIIKSILTDSQLKRVLFCATYRSNEMNEGHPLVSWQNEIEKRINNVHYISCNNFDLQEVQKLLSDAMRLEIEDVVDLAKVVHRRTHGNILYVLQLEKLQDNRLVSFDFLLSRWTYNLNEIEEQTSVSENVVELISSRIEMLQPQVQSVLKLASCLGAKFNRQTLALIKSVFHVVDPIEECLSHAESLDLIIKIDEQNYKFSHDTIQLATHSLLPKGKEMTRLHWDIGILLLHSEHISDTWIKFACADQFDKSLECIGSDNKDRAEIAELFLSVGSNSVELSAFVRAARYFKAGLEALGDAPFKIDYDIALKLYSSYSKAEFCAGDVDQSKRAAELILAHVQVGNSQLDAHLTLMSCLFSQGKTMECIDYSLDFLGQQGEELPKNPTPRQLRKEYQSMKKMLKNKSDDDILSLPPTNKSSKAACIKVLYDIINLCHCHDMESLMELSMIRMLRITMRDGITNFTPLALAMAGSYFVAFKTNIKEAYRFGNLAQKLAAKPSFAVSKCRTLWVVGTGLRPQLIPLSQSLDTLIEGHKAGMQFGDVTFAFQCITMYCINYYYSGLPLLPLLQDIENFCLQMLEYKQKFIFFVNIPLWQCLLNLCGRSDDPNDMEDGYAIQKLNEVENPKKMQESTWVYEMQLAFYMDNLDKATELMGKLKGISLGGMKRFTILGPSRIFFFSLIAISNFRRFKKRKHKIEAKRFIQDLRQLVKAGSINLVHRLQILDAEYLALTCRDFDQVYQSYRTAIASTTRTGFIQDGALANYLCFKFCKSTKTILQQTEHLTKSHELWSVWGAKAIAESLEHRHAPEFRHIPSNGTAGGAEKSFRGRPRFDRKYEQQHSQLTVGSSWAFFPGSDNSGF